MDTTTTPNQEAPTGPARCAHRTDLGLGCARAEHSADSAHWITGQPAAAFADLRRNGFWSRLVDTEPEAAPQRCLWTSTGFRHTAECDAKAAAR